MEKSVPEKRKFTLTIIQSTHASLSGMEECGLLDRHVLLLKNYSQAFDVIVYSSDTKDYSAVLGVRHIPVLWLPKAFGLKHILYYLWLVLNAVKMKGVIKVFGSNIPTLPLIKLLSRRLMVVTYQWDYANQTMKNEPTGLKHWFAPLLEKYAIDSANIVLVTAEWLETKIINNYHKKTILLPNWVNMDDLGSKSITRSHNDPLILYAGRLHWSKGIDILIKAFAVVKERYPGANLIILGEGEEKEKLKQLINSIAITGIHLNGKLSNSDVIKLMREADIFVLPTLTMEGHPKALIEAMACGTACITTKVRGNQEIIKDHVNGILVELGNSLDLAAAMIELLDDKTLRLKLGGQARDDARKFDFKVIVSKEINLLLALSERSS